MTVFDKIDPSRVRVQGKWATRDVWVNGEKLTPSEVPSRHGEGSKPGLYGWGVEYSDTIHERNCSVNLCEDICNYVEKVLHIPISYSFFRLLTEVTFYEIPQNDFDIIINTRGCTV